MAHINRQVKPRLLKVLKHSPVVFLNGPRQAGKSTLVQAIAKKEYPAQYVTFDSTTQMAAAASSPESYLRGRKGALVIDEVQLVPEIFRALKIIVDELRQAHGLKLKGRFLLTGSANSLALPKLSNPLVERTSIITLYPISSSEAMGGAMVILLSACLKKALKQILVNTGYSMQCKRQHFLSYLAQMLMSAQHGLMGI